MARRDDNLQARLDRDLELKLLVIARAIARSSMKQLAKELLFGGPRATDRDGTAPVNDELSSGGYVKAQASQAKGPGRI